MYILHFHICKYSKCMTEVHTNDYCHLFNKVIKQILDTLDSTNERYTNENTNTWHLLDTICIIFVFLWVLEPNLLLNSELHGLMTEKGASQMPGSMSASLILTLRCDRLLNHTENRASAFSSAGGVQMEHPLRASQPFCTVTFNCGLLQTDNCSLHWAFITSLKNRKSF